MGCRVGATRARACLFCLRVWGKPPPERQLLRFDRNPSQDDTCPGPPTRQVGSYRASGVVDGLRPRIFWPFPHAKAALVLDSGVRVCPLRRILTTASEAPARTCQRIAVL